MVSSADTPAPLLMELARRFDGHTARSAIDVLRGIAGDQISIHAG